MMMTQGMLVMMTPTKVLIPSSGEKEGVKQAACNDDENDNYDDKDNDNDNDNDNDDNTSGEEEGSKQAACHKLQISQGVGGQTVAGI